MVEEGTFRGDLTWRQLRSIMYLYIDLILGQIEVLFLVNIDWARLAYANAFT
jgi:hypothetical protein